MLQLNKSESISGLRFGPYITPVIASDVIVEREWRGLVTVVAVSDGPIAWPIGERDGERQLIVFKALARALRQETPAAIAAAWGVDLEMVERWRASCAGPRRRKKQTLASPAIVWTAQDDEVIASVSLADASRITGNTLTAIRKRRRALGLPDGRMATQRAGKREHDIVERIATLRRNLRSRLSELSNSIAQLRKTHSECQKRLAVWLSQASGHAKASQRERVVRILRYRRQDTA